MLQPKEKVVDIVNKLLDLNDLGDHEFDLFREIKSLDQQDPLTDLAYALFYSTKEENQLAEKYFKKSIRTNDYVCAGNYIAFLAAIRERIGDAIEMKNKYKDLLIRQLNATSLDLLVTLSSLEGNMAVLEECLMKLRKTKSGLKEHQTYIEEIMNSHKVFRETANISAEQVSLILKIMLDTFEASEIKDIIIPDYQTDKDHDINALVMYVTADDMDALVDANFTLAERIANEEQFIGKKFTPIFELYSADYPQYEEGHHEYSM